jgi:uncharacterized peroxidase-related enzyme
MAYIDLGPDERFHPGINGPMRFRPQTARHLNALAHELLYEENSLPRGDRELIAAYVSSQNQCEFCADSHSAFAAAQLPAGRELVTQVRQNLETAPVTEKLRSLLRIAGAVQKSGREVTAEMVEAARQAGATDVEIHDTVLIAAAFCMYNRYVDGLGTLVPEDPADYDFAAERIVALGYGAAARGEG